MPTFLKLHRADIAQRRVDSAVVVERHPVNTFVHGLPACREFPAVQTAHLGAAALKLRWSKFAAMGSLCLLSVLTTNFFLPLASCLSP